MKPNLLLPLLPLSVLLMTGCVSYDYQIVEPANLSRHVGDQLVTMTWDPLEYRFRRNNDRLAMTIVNPTTNRIVLLGDRSYVVDPKGESHPLRGQAIAPHSYTSMLLPPPQAVVQTTYPGIYAYGPGPVWYGPYWGGFYNDFYYGPVTSYYHVNTPYDWKWDVGQARLRLTYDQGGKIFDHDFVIARQPVK
jgi:hypothetical protein